VDFKDVEGNKHVVMYNKNLEKPLLIGGWPDLRNLYELQGDHNIYFGYVEHSCFHITVFPINANLCLLEDF